MVRSRGSSSRICSAFVCVDLLTCDFCFMLYSGIATSITTVRLRKRFSEDSTISLHTEKFTLKLTLFYFKENYGWADLVSEEIAFAFELLGWVRTLVGQRNQKWFITAVAWIVASKKKLAGSLAPLILFDGGSVYH